MKRPNTQNEVENEVPPVCRVRSDSLTLSNFRLVTVTGAPRLGDDVGHLLDLPLRTTEGTELLKVSGYGLLVWR